MLKWDAQAKSKMADRFVVLVKSIGRRNTRIFDKSKIRVFPVGG
jgi:hypothetical protein